MKKLLLIISLLLFTGFGFAQDQTQVEACDYSEYDHLQEKVNTILSQYDHLWDDFDVRLQLDNFMYEQKVKISEELLISRCENDQEYSKSHYECPLYQGLPVFSPSIHGCPEELNPFWDNMFDVEIDDSIACDFLSQDSIKKLMLLQSIHNYINAYDINTYGSLYDAYKHIAEDLLTRIDTSQIVFGASNFQQKEFGECRSLDQFYEENRFDDLMKIFIQDYKQEQLTNSLDMRYNGMQHNHGLGYLSLEGLESQLQYRYKNIYENTDYFDSNIKEFRGETEDSTIYTPINQYYGSWANHNGRGCLSNDQELFVLNYRGGIGTYDILTQRIYVPKDNLTILGRGNIGVGCSGYGFYRNSVVEKQDDFISYGRTEKDTTPPTVDGENLYLGKYYYTTNEVYIEKICDSVEKPDQCTTQDQRFRYDE